MAKPVSMSEQFVAVVLAAGLGTRMKSPISKVLHLVAGRPLVYFPVKAAFDAGASQVALVVNRDNADSIGAYLESEFGKERVVLAVQDPPRGTGDAARIGVDALPEAKQIAILCGDTPLLRAEELMRLMAGLEQSEAHRLSFMTCQLDEPGSYGRVLRGAEGQVLQIREYKDTKSHEERAIREVNAGVYLGERAFLVQALSRLSADNAQAEYYLTDIVEQAAEEGAVVAVQGPREALLGVNDRAQLAEAERGLFKRIAEDHGRRGVTIKGSPRIDHGVEIEVDATIEDGVCLRGNTKIGGGSVVDVGCVITDSEIGRSAMIKPYTVIIGSVVGEWSEVGPFAHLRPESQLDDRVRVGNFVEVKKTRLRKGAKASHLSYLGDGDIGEEANIGAGTIFCNYDGFKKHRTLIGAGAFVGSDSQLVAPVTIGAGAYVATGTTVTQDVPTDALAISRTKQENKLGYAARLRGRLQAVAKKDSEKWRVESKK